jgi:outer membrane protein
VLQAEDGVELAKNRLKRSKDHLTIAEERKAAGAVPQADVTRTRTELSAAELDVAAAENALRIARGRLNEAMGRNAASTLNVVRPALEPVDPQQTNIQQVLEKAPEQRPEILAALKRAEAKRSQIGAVRSEILPRVRAEAGYGWRDDDFEQIDKDWWVGVTLNIPLFDGGVRSHRITKSRIEADRELHQVKQLKLAVQQEIWTAYSQWIEAFQALHSSTVMKQEAAETMDLFQARYEEWAGTINDLLDAEFAFNQSETQVNNARYRLQSAYAAFKRAAGEL